MDSYDLYRFLWSDKSEIKKKAEMIYDSILFDRDRVLQDAVDIRYDLCGPPMLGLYLNSLKQKFSYSQSVTIVIKNSYL